MFKIIKTCIIDKRDEFATDYSLNPARYDPFGKKIEMRSNVDSFSTSTLKEEEDFDNQFEMLMLITMKINLIQLQGF